MLFAGVDDDGEARLFETEPTGMFFQYKATVIGEGETEIKELLAKEYKETMSIEDGIKLSIKALKSVLGKDFDIKRIDCAFVKKENAKFERPDAGYIRKIMKI